MPEFRLPVCRRHSDRLEPFRAAGLHAAMYVVPTLFALLAVVLFAASRTVKGDVQKLQAWMRQSAAAQRT